MRGDSGSLSLTTLECYWEMIVSLDENRGWLSCSTWSICIGNYFFSDDACLIVSRWPIWFSLQMIAVPVASVAGLFLSSVMVSVTVFASLAIVFPGFIASKSVCNQAKLLFLGSRWWHWLRGTDAARLSEERQSIRSILRIQSHCRHIRVIRLRTAGFRGTCCCLLIIARFRGDISLFFFKTIITNWRKRAMCIELEISWSSNIIHIWSLRLVATIFHELL